MSGWYLNPLENIKTEPHSQRAARKEFTMIYAEKAKYFL
jgi:hypothetical protein